MNLFKGFESGGTGIAPDSSWTG